MIPVSTWRGQIALISSLFICFFTCLIASRDFWKTVADLSESKRRINYGSDISGAFFTPEHGELLDLAKKHVNKFPGVTNPMLYIGERIILMPSSYFASQGPILRGLAFIKKIAI
jgi:hypothetical protein